MRIRIRSSHLSHNIPLPTRLPSAGYLPVPTLSLAYAHSPLTHAKFAICVDTGRKTTTKRRKLSTGQGERKTTPTPTPTKHLHSPPQTEGAAACPLPSRSRSVVLLLCKVKQSTAPAPLFAQLDFVSCGNLRCRKSIAPPKKHL